MTDHSSNGVWVGGVRTKKGVPGKVAKGDKVVLSELTKLYSWKLCSAHIEEERNDEPSAKRRKVIPGEVAGVGEGKEEKAISQRRKVAEVRMLREKLILENAVKVGQQRQAALMANNEMLLTRLEEQAKKQNKREREAREKKEKEMEEKDEREQIMREFDVKIKLERENEEAEKKTFSKIFKIIFLEF